MNHSNPFGLQQEKRQALLIQRRARERGLEKRVRAVQVEKERTVQCELLFQSDHEGNMVSDTTLENGGFGDFETKFLEWIVVDDDWVA
jgi:hypothetical protein